MTTPFGAPFELRSQSLVSTLIVEPTLGLDTSKSPPNLAPGFTPNSDNFIMRDGALEPRSMLSLVNNTPQPMAARVLGGIDIVSVAGAHYPLVSGTTQIAWYNNPAWSVASYVSAAGFSDPPAGSDTNYWDWTQIYDADIDENIAVGALGSRQSLYCWAAATGVFSTLTGAPGATSVAAFDNYLLAANVTDADGTEVQRVRWSDRGNPSNWTTGLSGFEDLLAAKGAITRMLPLENRVAVFFDDEIWYGVPVQFPGIWQFTPLDTTVGCPYPWTATVTSQGVLFVARGFQVYLLPKEGGAAQPVGQRLHRTLRDTIVQPTRAFGVHDPINTQYQLYYPIANDESLPTRAAFLHLDSGAWAPQSFSRTTDYLALTRGFSTQFGYSRASVWDDYSESTGSTWNQLAGMSWNDITGTGDARASVFLGSSAGTIYSLSSAATSDNGNPVQSFWESAPLEGGAPGVQKSISEIRLDYTAPSPSTLTVRTSPSQGAAFDAGTLVSFASISNVSQAVAYTRQASRYPVVRVESEGQQYRLHRLHIAMRFGGR